jgi:hypothetical protein
MTNIIQFIPKHAINAAENLAEFIRLCREELTVFGSDLKWEQNYWPTARITFGNLDQKTRVLDPDKTMQPPFLDFAKAYFRYQQGHKPTQSSPEIRALKCIERALFQLHNNADISNLNALVLDQSALLAKAHFSSGMAYHTGREIARLATFVSDKQLISGRLDWKSPITRPTDTVRTGVIARQQREDKLPNAELLDALADIFASNPTVPKDIFTSSVCAMLLCAPSRISEILALPVDCEVWQTKRDGNKAYGWRFQPGKGGVPCIKWISDAMISISQESIDRIRRLTDEARNIAKWYGMHPDQLYQSNLNTSKKPPKLPEDFPWFDKARRIRFSEALFCFQANQLHVGLSASQVMIWRPTANTLNDDLRSRESSPGYFNPSIFDRHGFNSTQTESLKVSSHQFRHLLNTMAQRGGLTQAEIARWSGRADMSQNRVYDHMSEFELVDMLRVHDDSLSLDQPLQEIAEQIAAKIPMTRQEFNTLAIPTAHVTEYGFCIHDFTMSPCQRFRDCLNCTEQVCIKGDRRIDRLKERYTIVKQLKDKAQQEINDGTAGADRWYQIHDLTEKRVQELIGIMENPAIQNGAIIKLRNENEFSPLRRAINSKTQKNLHLDQNQPLLEDVKNLLGGGLG